MGLGALGVIATVTLRTDPAFTIRRVDSPLPLEETLERVQDLADGSDHFEFYVFPHTETALLRQSSAPTSRRSLATRCSSTGRRLCWRTG